MVPERLISAMTKTTLLSKWCFNAPAEAGDGFGEGVGMGESTINMV